MTCSWSIWLFVKQCEVSSCLNQLSALWASPPSMSYLVLHQLFISSNVWHLPKLLTPGHFRDNWNWIHWAPTILERSYIQGHSCAFQLTSTRQPTKHSTTYKRFWSSRGLLTGMHFIPNSLLSRCVSALLALMLSLVPCRIWLLFYKGNPSNNLLQ